MRKLFSRATSAAVIAERFAIAPCEACGDSCAIPFGRIATPDHLRTEPRTFGLTEAFYGSRRFCADEASVHGTHDRDWSLLCGVCDREDHLAFVGRCSADDFRGRDRGHRKQRAKLIRDLVCGVHEVALQRAVPRSRAS